jgi:hypothetical protein
VADLHAKLLTDQLSDRKRRNGEHPPDDQDHQNDNEVNVWYENNEIGEGHQCDQLNEYSEIDEKLALSARRCDEESGRNGPGPVSYEQHFVCWTWSTETVSLWVHGDGHFDLLL